MNRNIGWAAGLVMVAAGGAMAQSEYIFKDPEMDFEVLDFQPFDGIGDSGPWTTFNTVGLGTEGDDREIAEFDLSTVFVGEGEVVTEAIYEVQITSILVSGLGVNAGNTPDQLSVYGYAGDGAASLEDFQAGAYLDSADTSNPFVGQIVSFDVTSHVADLIVRQERFAGLVIRGDEVGLMAILENGEYPRLTVRTGAGGGCYADFTGDGTLDLFDFLAFVNEFNAGADQADCDDDGEFTLFDFLCFTNAYNAGC
jgi:hypothetical protein